MVRRHILVSTHSRLKAAGRQDNPILSASLCFNTQPPEGGWMASALRSSTSSCFNTQPPEGGWLHKISKMGRLLVFQHTAARRRLVEYIQEYNRIFFVSTHSRPKAAGKDHDAPVSSLFVSTHSRPKAAGTPCGTYPAGLESFNTQPPEGGWTGTGRGFLRLNRFNTQPPEGGWASSF